MKPHKLDVRFLSIAQDDLYEVITYIGLDNPAAAESLAAEIEKSFIHLTKASEAGPNSTRRGTRKTWISLSDQRRLLAVKHNPI